MELSKSKVLYFSAQLPSIRVPVAGQKVAWQNLCELAVEHEIFLISFINLQEGTFLKVDDYNFCNKVEFINLKRNRKLINIVNRIQLPIKITGRFSKKVFDDIIETIEKNHIEKVFFEFTSSLLYAYKLKQVKPNLEVSIVEHDVTFQAYKRLANSRNFLKRLFYSIEYKRMKKFEISTLKSLDHIYLLNAKDQLIMEDYDIKNTSVKYPKVEDWIYRIERNKIENYSILFLGAMHRAENEDAVLWFYNNVFEDVKLNYPSSKFYIVGGSPSSRIKYLELKDKNVVVTGYVESLKPYFEKSQIAIAPLQFGAGIKIKTIETISAGIPTIASEIGAEGVKEDPNLHVAYGKSDFLRLTLNHLSN